VLVPIVILSLKFDLTISKYKKNVEGHMEKTESYPSCIVDSKEIIRIKVKGDKEDLKDFARMLEKNKIIFYPIHKTRAKVGEPQETRDDLFKMRLHHRESKRSETIGEFYHLFPDSILPDAFAAFASIFIVELTKKAAKAILDWLKKRKREKRNPKLKVMVGNKTVTLNSKQIKALNRILEEPEKPSRRGKRISSRNIRDVRPSRRKRS
jgi:hypothetical protein